MPCLRKDAAAREHINGLVSRRAEEVKTSHGGRSLQAGGCFTRAVYDDIVDDIGLIADGLANVTDGGPRDKGHFFGGIVRLAAHDFMDFDQRPADNQGFPLGQDGCIDWNTQSGGSGADNAGLETIWCDDTAICPLKNIYDTIYRGIGVGRADFWVAAAQAVIKITSKAWTDTSGAPHADLDLPFRYGRVDNDDCEPPTVDSAHRLPGAQHCDEVNKTFVTQMGLSWRDGVALLGAHTLGYGFAANSNHDGMWMDEEVETIVFDKRYYEEIFRRAWRQRNMGAANQDWTWAGNNQGNPRFMLNADLCLAFDIDAAPDCCTRIRQGGAVPGEAFCVDPALNLNATELIGTIDECETSQAKRPEAFQAVTDFHVSLNNNQADNNAPFYEAFAAAWKLATEAGYAAGQLRNVADTCDPTESPTTAPTVSPTVSPTFAPTASPTLRPTPTCTDDVEFINDKGNPQDCAWVVNTGKCGRYGVDHCPVSCQMCGCAGRDAPCTSSGDCCSNDCRGDGTCRGS